MTRRIVDEAIRTSRMRMGVESLDLLQFHWWEYDDDAERAFVILNRDPKSPQPGQVARVSHLFAGTRKVEDVSPRSRLTQGSEHPIVVWSLLELERF
jgi:hypothetical protein